MWHPITTLSPPPPPAHTSTVAKFHTAQFSFTPKLKIVFTLHITLFIISDSS